MAPVEGFKFSSCFGLDVFVDTLTVLALVEILPAPSRGGPVERDILWWTGEALVVDDTNNTTYEETGGDTSINDKHFFHKHRTVAKQQRFNHVNNTTQGRLQRNTSILQKNRSVKYDGNKGSMLTFVIF